MDFLSEIIAAKRKRLEAAKATVPLAEISTRANRRRSDDRHHRFSDAVRGWARINIIAEFKRRSPSKGDINIAADASTFARAYEKVGAAAISVLTEEDYFGGSLDDLHTIRKATSIPILRKDFIFDEYQVFESALAGADALLLIAAALDDETLTKLLNTTERYLWMDALVEVHTKEELDRALRCGARLIGVNNRDLRTFSVSTDTSFELGRLVPQGISLVSESGLTPPTIRDLRLAGYNAFLVGEAFMRSEKPAMALNRYIVESTLRESATQVKICGITNIDDARAAIEAGADMLGFNFYPESPRFIEPKAVREIMFTVRTGKWVRAIGIFVNETLERIKQVERDANLDGVQLHGDETAEFCDRLKEGVAPRFLIKAVATNEAIDFDALERYPVDAFMFDAHDPGRRGGTGRIADWAVAQEAVKRLPQVFLAGGLSAENVADAISAVQPYAVDACSALELAPGKKDFARMKEFVAAVRAVRLPSEVSAS
ncbi:MAG: indole-3-glycerol phosphate synthase TrpC [Pyrinomonadaceae bacterium]